MTLKHLRTDIVVTEGLLNHMNVATPENEVIQENEPTVQKEVKKDKRYNLVLPQVIFDEVQAIADEHDTTVADLIKKFIKLGLIVANLENDPDAALIIREGNKEREVMLL